MEISLTVRRLLLLSVVTPCLKYGSEIWDCNKSQTRALESIKILGCSSNDAVWGDMGLETLKSRRARAKLKWCYKVCIVDCRITGIPNSCLVWSGKYNHIKENLE